MTDLTPLELTQDVLDISVTEREKFKTCRRQWELEVIENLMPKIPQGMALDFGSGIHEALEAYYLLVSQIAPSKARGELYGDPRTGALMAWDNWKTRAENRIEDDAELVEEAKDELWDELQRLISLGEEMVEGYCDYAEEADEFTVHAVEGRSTSAGRSWLKKHQDDREFLAEHSASAVVLHESGRLLCPIIDPSTQTPIEGSPVISAKIDLLVNDIREGRKGLWIYDHKTTTSQPSDRGLDFFDQPTGYSYIVWRWLGILPRGVVYNYLLKKEPKEPKILASGKLSTDKAQLTTPDWYWDVMEDMGLTGSTPHIETYEALLDRGPRFFDRHEVLRSKHELKEFEKRLFQEYTEMYDVWQGDMPAYPNFSPPRFDWCKDCSVNRICQSIEDGSDTDAVIKFDFMQRPDRKAMKHY